jgi:hypothetical protein
LFFADCLSGLLGSIQLPDTLKHSGMPIAMGCGWSELSWIYQMRWAYGNCTTSLKILMETVLIGAGLVIEGSGSSVQLSQEG